MSHVNERVRFRLIVCPECNHQMCWINPRPPSYCPECAKLIHVTIRTHPETCVMIDDDTAWLRYNYANACRVVERADGTQQFEHVAKESK